MKHTVKRAFTLIELLIVIAIIGILFVVLVSRVDFATDKAKATGVQTDFRSFQLAFEQAARENAGFNVFGWDTGDANGDRIRNSYDRGDTNKNGKEDPGETFTGRKTYGETWTTIYTMLNPDTTKPNDTSAFEALERAINSNLDPKLHITITPDVEGGALTGNATITMANQARDPWKNEYHGVFITNAARDNGADRGAIIIYSDGANGKWGSAHDIANGVVSITVPGNNKYGQDDYSLTTIYTYEYGYGEVKTSSLGFASSNKVPVGNNGGEVSPSTPDDCRHTDTNHDDFCDSCGEALVIIGTNSKTEYNEEFGCWEPTEEFLNNSEQIADKIITFTGGKFESAFNYTGATWEIVQYTIQETKVKKPEPYMGGTMKSNVNILSSVGHNGTDYILMHMTGDYELVDGGAQILSRGFTTYRYLQPEDQTLDNMIYLAAYMQNYLKRTGDIFIAQWDPNLGYYKPLDCSAEINAITDFTYTTMTTVTQQVLVSPAEKVSNLVFIPTGNMQAEEGMTWREWLQSSYNTTGFSNTTIRSGDGGVVSLDSVIEAGEAYGVYDAPKTILQEPGLYQTGSNYTVQTHTWEDLLNSGLITVTNGVLMGSQNIAGDLIIPDGIGIVEIHYDAFTNSGLTSVSIPSSVKRIGSNAFQYCENLVSVELNEGLEWMGSVVFKGCKSLEGLILPDSLVSWNHASGNEFLGCTSMKYFKLGSGLTEVPVLYGNFDTMVIPEGYLDMGRGTIAMKCANLYIPKSIVEFGVTNAGSWGIFSNWNVGTVYYAGTEEEWNDISGIEYITYENIVFNTHYGSQP